MKYGPPKYTRQELFRLHARNRQRRRRSRIVLRRLDDQIAALLVRPERPMRSRRVERRGYVTRWTRSDAPTPPVSEFDALGRFPFSYPRLPIYRGSTLTGYQFIRDREQYRVAHRAAIDRYLFDSRRPRVRRRVRHDFDD